jgi:glucose-6-phosphate 1-epimerase
MMLFSSQRRCRLVHDSGARAEWTPYGAQVRSWHCADGCAPLLLSERAVYREAAAIRSGVPVIFPQFATEGVLPRHGFVRTATWRIHTQTATVAVLEMDES